PPIAMASTSATATVKPGARERDRDASRRLPTLLREAKPVPAQAPERRGVSRSPRLVLSGSGTGRPSVGQRALSEVRLPRARLLADLLDERLRPASVRAFVVHDLHEQPFL